MDITTILDFSSLLGKRYLRTVILFSLICGSLYLYFWIIARDKLFHLKVLKNLKIKPMPIKEAVMTFANLALYLIPIGLAIIVKEQFGYSMKQDNLFEYGIIYPIMTLFVMIFMVDTNFYWVHRWMHEKKIKAHKSHHVFVNPTPWAAYGVHFFEGFLLSIPYYIILLAIPWHPITMLILGLFAFFYNSFIHLGFDPTPKKWRKHKLLKWMNTPSHHSLHHYYHNTNYGLYFSFWDKIMGTEQLD